MKIAPLLVVIFFIGMVVFGYLYFQERAEAGKHGFAGVRERLVTARDKIDHIRATDTLEKGDTIGSQLEVLGLHGNDIDFSQPISDVRKAKAYIRNYETMVMDLLGDLDQAGLPPLTEEIWMDSASICGLGRLITKYQYNGLRLYPAAYGLQRADNDPQRADKGDYDYRMTLIVVPTKSDPDQTHKNNHIDVYTDPKTNELSGLVDYHDICPPTCPSVSGAARGDILADPTLFPVNQ